MLRDWLHDRMPRSLVARAALILLLPVVTLQLVVGVSFVQRYYEDVTRQMTRALLLELRFLDGATSAAPDLGTARAYAAAAAAPLELNVTLPAQAPPGDIIDRWDLAGRAMADTLRGGLPELEAVDLSVPRRVTIWLGTPHGDLEVEFSRRRVAAQNPHQLLVLTLVLGLLMSAVAYLFLRNQLRPILRLASAATAYGRGRVVPFRPSGASEVATGSNARARPGPPCSPASAMTSARRSRACASAFRSSTTMTPGTSSETWTTWAGWWTRSSPSPAATPAMRRRTRPSPPSWRPSSRTTAAPANP
jgi:two-component system osmolarity sensor histidine kinase EnvZ